jgi:hypothetical protein
VKFKENVVGLTTTQAFFDKFVNWYKNQRYLQSDKFKERLSSRWCKAEYSKRETIEALEDNQKSHYRYKAVNCNALPLYGTIEFRIMPWMPTGKSYYNYISLMLTAIDRIISELLQDTEESEAMTIIKSTLQNTIIIYDDITCIETPIIHQEVV